MELVEENPKVVNPDKETMHQVNINLQDSFNSNLKMEGPITYKKLLIYYTNKIYDNLNPDTKMLIVNVMAFILYLISLIGCKKGEENVCVTDFMVQFVIEGILVLINSIIITINIWLKK